MSSSQSHRSGRSVTPEKQKPKVNKIFVTNLDGETPQKKLQADLQEMFSKYGELDTVVVKRSYNGQYSFAFIQYKEGEDATEAVNNLNHQYIGDKKMRVELQDNSRRRKGAGEGCYLCGKVGHFARECHSNNERKRYSRRSRSHSHHHKKPKRKHSSSSESRLRKKQKKKHDSKLKKKHTKKSKRDRRYSDSDSSD